MEYDWDTLWWHCPKYLHCQLLLHILVCSCRFYWLLDLSGKSDKVIVLAQIPLFIRKELTCFLFNCSNTKNMLCSQNHFVSSHSNFTYIFTINKRCFSKIKKSFQLFKVVKSEIIQKTNLSDVLCGYVCYASTRLIWLRTHIPQFEFKFLRQTRCRSGISILHVSFTCTWCGGSSAKCILP